MQQKYFGGSKQKDSRLRETPYLFGGIFGGWMCNRDIKATVETSGGKDDGESMMANKFSLQGFPH